MGYNRAALGKVGRAGVDSTSWGAMPPSKIEAQIMALQGDDAADMPRGIGSDTASNADSNAESSSRPKRASFSRQIDDTASLSGVSEGGRRSSKGRSTSLSRSVSRLLRRSSSGGGSKRGTPRTRSRAFSWM
eukprot:4483688-Prymnesium_polylepis.2